MVNPIISNFMSRNGAIGGARGTGESKRRSKEHYSAAGKLSALKKKLEKEGVDFAKYLRDQKKYNKKV